MNNFERYIKLHQIQDQYTSIPRVDAWVVIPCYNEPDIYTTLLSLYYSDRVNLKVGIIVVVNDNEQSAPDHIEQNEQTCLSLQRFILDYASHDFSIVPFYLPQVKWKYRGPGIARKRGMDYAAIHHYYHHNETGVIISLDADCLVGSNYFKEIITSFQADPQLHAAAIDYEHLAQGEFYEQCIYDAIVIYEIYLRYYTLALKSTGYPYSFQTIGSAFSVRANCYINQGGMNKKNAGEDFYFLQKIIPLGHFKNITSTTILVSPRPSDRVIFGTGPSVKKIIEDKKLLTYPLALFNELKPLINKVDTLFTDTLNLSILPICLQSFLIDQKFEASVQRIKNTSTTIDVFRRKFFQYFDGFMVVKFLNYGITESYTAVDVIPEARLLTQQSGILSSNQELLNLYRELSRFEK